MRNEGPFRSKELNGIHREEDGNFTDLHRIVVHRYSFFENMHFQNVDFLYLKSLEQSLAKLSDKIDR